MKYISQILIAGLLITATTPALTSELPGDGKTVRPIFTEDPAALFQAEVVGIALARLGYQLADLQYVDIPAAYLTIAQGDADYYAQSWDPLQNDSYNRAGGAEKLTRVGRLIKDAAQGYLIDKATADSKGVRSLEQLKDPEIAKLFDGDGDGLADLIGCPPGWGCEAIIEYHLDAYELRNTVEHVQGDFTAIHVDAVTRAKAGESVLYYTYTPLWLGQILVPGTDVEWLEVGETKLPPDQMTESTLAPDGRNLGWAMNDIRIAANNTFLADNPAAAKLFEVMVLPLADVNAQNLLVYNGERSDEDIRRHAEEWVAANASVVDGWIDEALASAQ